MVNTVVTFGNNRFPSIPPVPIVIENDYQSTLQRRIYLIIGIVLLISIIIPNILAISNDYDDFAYHLLFIFHASTFEFFLISPFFLINLVGCLGLFFISTAIYRSKYPVFLFSIEKFSIIDIGDGISTISSLILLAVYKTINYLIRYRYCPMNSRKDFLITTVS
jgi:hypothetical protein